jgi:hypothetical protein
LSQIWNRQHDQYVLRQLLALNRIVSPRGSHARTDDPSEDRRIGGL